MKFTFQDSIAEVLPITAPEYFAQKVGDQLEFAVAGWDVTSKDYLVALSLHQAPLSDALNLRRLTAGGLDNAQRTPFLMDRYLKERADRVVSDWPSFVAKASFFADNIRSGSLNVAELDTQNIAPTSGTDRLKMVTAARMIVEKVMLQNGIDVLVIPNIPAPVEKNEYARDPVTQGIRPNGPSITDLLGRTRNDRARRLQRHRLRRPVPAQRRQEELRRRCRHRAVHAPRAHADQHDVLGGRR